MAIEAVPVVITPGTPPAPPEGVTITDNGTVIPNELMPQGEEKLFAGKYKTVEELEKGYIEAQKKMGATPPAAKPAIETPPAKSEEQNAEQKTGLAAIEAEYAKTGAISEEQYAALEKAGQSREVVDNYLRGQVALGTQTRAELANSIGGEEKMVEVLKWASASLSKEEVAAYNATLETNNMGLAKLALAGVAAKYAAEFPAEPLRVSGQGAGVTAGSKPFQNPTEMHTAMNDKRYATDHVYRKEVEARVMASPRW